MIAKSLVVVLCLCLAVQSARAQDWQAAEMVDEIRHTTDSLWIPDRRAPVASPQAPVAPQSQVRI